MVFPVRVLTKICILLLVVVGVGGGVGDCLLEERGEIERSKRREMGRWCVYVLVRV